jgi:hypothetical protein
MAQTSQTDHGHKPEELNSYIVGRKLIAFLTRHFGLTEKNRAYMIDALTYFAASANLQSKFIQEFDGVELQAQVSVSLFAQKPAKTLPVNAETLRWSFDLPCAEVVAAGNWWDKAENYQLDVGNEDLPLTDFYNGITLLTQFAERVGQEAVEQALKEATASQEVAASPEVAASQETVASERTAAANDQNPNMHLQFLTILSNHSGCSVEELQEVCDNVRNS